MPPDTYEWLCPADLERIAEGYRTRHRDEWERALITVAPYTKRPLRYEDLFKQGEQSVTPDKEGWERLKSKFEERRHGDQHRNG